MAGMELGLSGRTALITGASGGIGAATALALSAEGVRVILVGRRVDPLHELARRCSDGCVVVPAELTDPAGMDAVIRTALFGPAGAADILVNNAGTTTVTPYDEISDAEWQAQWELNVMAPMRLMRALAPQMAARRWGRIVNVSSSSGKRPSGMNMAYGVTKTAMLSLSRSFADLFASQGVLVNAITPGPIGGDAWLADGGLADQRAQAAGRSRDELLDAVAAGLPIKRLGTNEEIAAVITFLCSERASNVAGAAWSVDGGAVPGIL